MANKTTVNERLEAERLKYRVDPLISEGHKILTDIIHNNCRYMLKLLIEKGLDFKYIDDEPIKLAAREGNVTIVEMLIDAGADPKAAIKEAAREGHLDILKMLKEKGINIGEYVNKHDHSLMYAAQNADVKMFKFFIREGVDIKSKWDVVVPYCIVAGDNDINIAKIIKMMINIGVDVSKCITFTNMTLIDEAIRKGHKRVLRLLLENGCSNTK